MAQVTHGGSLPDNSNKTDFYNIIDNGTVTNIVNGDISVSAAIADSKLATIVSAGKVDGTSIIDLAGVPSGAGILPALNLPNSIADSHLAIISTPGKVSGAALTSLTSIPSGAGIIPSANLPAVTHFSNVLFQYCGQIDAHGVDVGEVVGATLTPSGVTGNYRFLQISASTNTIWSSKFIKISGLNTVTIYARTWTDSGGYTFQIAIGAASGSISSLVNTTPAWETFTIDVSALTNGTVYDVTANFPSSNHGYVANIIGFGS